MDIGNLVVRQSCVWSTSLVNRRLVTIMRKQLRESIADLEDYRREVEEGLPECLKLYKEDEEYKELGVLLGCLEALGIMHHAHHWQTLGGQLLWRPSPF